MIECRPLGSPGGIDMNANPIADLAVGGAISHDLDNGFRSYSSGTNPAGIEPFVEKIFMLIGV